MAACMALPVVATLLYGSAHQPTPNRIPPGLSAAIRQIDPPITPGAWVLQVVSRGGLDGNGTGDFILHSTGEAASTRPAAAALAPEVIAQLDQSIRGIPPSQWTPSTPSRLCSDCVVTLMHLTLRATDGSVQTYTTFWDPTSQAQVSPALVRIHDLARTAMRR